MGYEQMIKFWWRSRSQIRIHILTLVRCALVEVCTVPVLLVVSLIYFLVCICSGASFMCIILPLGSVQYWKIILMTKLPNELWKIHGLCRKASFQVDRYFCVCISGAAVERCKQPLVRLATRCPWVHSYPRLIERWTLFDDFFRHFKQRRTSTSERLNILWTRDTTGACCKKQIAKER